MEHKVVGYHNLEVEIENLIEIVQNSKEFRSMEGKTQIIFTRSARSDIRNRLTYTYEVARISEEIAKRELYDGGKSLPKEKQRLAYLIGLCHDLGHTAFGHDGESRINEACRKYQLIPGEFDEFFYGERNSSIGIEAKQPEYYFEHHAHSVRVFLKILKDNNIELEDELKGDILQSILCHSTSRTKDKEVRKAIWAITRFADKIYSYTDMADILATGLDINSDILDDINKKKKYITKEGVEHPFTDDDKRALESVITQLSKKDGLEEYMVRYVNECELIKTIDESGESYTFLASKDMRREMKILKTLAKYLREERILKKEELKARAMTDEVLEYIIGNEIAKEMEAPEACYKASMIVANSTDAEVREIFRKVTKIRSVKDLENVKLADDTATRLSANDRSKTYPIQLTLRERMELYENPECMVQVR